MTLLLQPSLPFCELPERAVTGEPGGPTHLLIEGENLATLTALRTVYEGQVDAIYIDPPYNTGAKDFSYQDVFTTQDGNRHRSWLEFMRSRLELARTFLAPHGLIFISIDEHEFAHLKLLCDDLFGEDQFVANVVWDKRNPKGDAHIISSVTEYILVYAKDIKRVPALRVRKESAAAILRKAAALWHQKAHSPEEKRRLFRAWLRTQPFSEGDKAYCKLDDQGRPYRATMLNWPGAGGFFYPVLHPVTGMSCAMPKTGWRLTEAHMREFMARGEILFGQDETTIPTRLYYLDEHLETTLTDLIHYAGNGLADFDFSLLSQSFNNPKPVYLIQRLLEYTPKDALILDFFAGSGTTGQAVLALNQADGGQRQFLLVTSNENQICEQVTYPRLKHVMCGYTTRKGKQVAGLGGTLRYFRAA